MRAQFVVSSHVLPRSQRALHQIALLQVAAVERFVVLMGDETTWQHPPNVQIYFSALGLLRRKHICDGLQYTFICAHNSNNKIPSPHNKKVKTELINPYIHKQNYFGAMFGRTQISTFFRNKTRLRNTASSPTSLGIKKRKLSGYVGWYR